VGQALSVAPRNKNFSAAAGAVTAKISSKSDHAKMKISRFADCVHNTTRRPFTRPSDCRQVPSYPPGGTRRRRRRVPSYPPGGCPISTYQAKILNLLINGSASAKVCVAIGSDGARREAADTNRSWCWRGGMRDAILPACAWPCPCNVRAGAYSYMGAFASTSRLSAKLVTTSRGFVRVALAQCVVAPSPPLREFL